MLFNSLEFLVFFPSVVVLFFLLRHQLRWILLLLASYYFYMCWRPEYLLLILASTGIDYVAGLQMAKTRTATRTPWLLVSLTGNLGLLFFFKYFNFFGDAASALFAGLGMDYVIPHLNVLLPVGISFYTFQTMSYTIDVYRGMREPERHLGIFALYVAFFPQLVAGPIERSTHLMPQFREEMRFDPERVSSGLKLMLWGMFKKVVIADRLAVVVEQVYSNPEGVEGPQLLIATYFFAFQIFCDFSGYSDIAIGAAQTMGFRLMKNFDRPYHSRSISEFWHRWHISLSTWFRDYVYIPLGGNRVPKARWYLNLMLVFIVSGIWHGANYTFIVWGALHGTYQLVSVLTQGQRRRVTQLMGLAARPRLLAGWRMFCTFHLVCLGWIFFRADSLSDAWYILTHLASGFDRTWQLVLSPHGPFLFCESLGMTVREFGVALLSICALEAVHLLQQGGSIREMVGRWSMPLRWSVYAAAVWAILLLGRFGEQQFIYFQF